MRAAVLASGRGSNFDALVAARARGALPGAELVGLVCDVEGAPVLGKAARAGVPARWVGRAEGEPREAHEGRVLRALEEWAPQWIVLAGYMRVLSPAFLARFAAPGGVSAGGAGYARVTNIHPSLLPAFPGRDAYGQAWRAGVQLTGATVHLLGLDGGVDTGPICAQEAFPIGDCRSVAEVEARGLEVEHRLYPAALAQVLAGRFEVVEVEGGRRVRTH